MMMATERVLDPTIQTDWERVAIMEVIEHWQEHARDDGTWKRAKKLARKLLWLLPESRSGEHLRSPLDHSPVCRPKHPWTFAVTRRECEILDSQCYEIFDRYCPANRVGKDRECVVCLGAGWLPLTSYNRQSSRSCEFCDGQGVVTEVVS